MWAWTLTFADGLTGAIRLTRGELQVKDELTIAGGGQITITGDAAGNDVTDCATGATDIDASQAAAGGLLAGISRVFNTSDNLTLTGGVSPDDGGLEDEGGALYVHTGDATLAKDVVSGNRSYESGGGVYVDGLLTINSSTFTNNATKGEDGYGGAVYAAGALTVTGSTFIDIKTIGEDADGGAIYAENFATISSLTFANNETVGEDASGGAPFAEKGADITNSTFVNNCTLGEDAYGGAIYSNGGSIRISHSTILGNQTLGFAADNSFIAGAEIYADESPLTIENSIIVGNEVPLAGGPEITAFEDERGDGTITFLRQNIVGADATAFDASVSAKVRNADPALIFDGGFAGNAGRCKPSRSAAIRPTRRLTQPRRQSRWTRADLCGLLTSAASTMAERLILAPSNCRSARKHRRRSLPATPPFRWVRRCCQGLLLPL